MCRDKRSRRPAEAVVRRCDDKRQCNTQLAHLDLVTVAYGPVLDIAGSTTTDVRIPCDVALNRKKITCYWSR